MLFTGKLSPEKLQELVLPFLGAKRPEVLVHSQLGEDSAVLDFGEYVCVISTDPITGSVENIGRLAVYVSCNDVASCGASPLGIMMTLLAPEGCSEGDIERVMRQVSDTSSELGIEVLGGHTEITPKVKEMIISTTAIGRAPRNHYVTSSGASPGEDIVMTKDAGLEGTSIIASDFEELLIPKLGYDLIKRAQNFISEINVVPEGVLAASLGATAMHDATEGGIYGALYEIAQASQIGFEIWEDKIPIRSETKKICEHFGLNPYGLISSGCMLIVAEEGGRIVYGLKEIGVKATIIGRTAVERRVVVRGGEIITFQPPKRDELWRLLDERT